MPNLKMRVVEVDKYLHFYKVGVRETVLTGVSLIGRVIVSRIFPGGASGTLRISLNNRNKWIWI